MDAWISIECISAPMLAHKAVQSGIKLRLILIGEGDAYNQLQNISESYDYIQAEQIMEQKRLLIFFQNHI